MFKVADVVRIIFYFLCFKREKMFSLEKAPVFLSAVLAAICETVLKLK